jgi:hypothetical protein
MSAPPDIVGPTHVRFVPFEMHSRRDKVLVGRDDRRDWIVLDPSAAEIMTALDRGVAIEEIEVTAVDKPVSAEDVLELVRELEAIGFVAAIGSRPHGSSRVDLDHRRVRSPWLWRSLEVTCAVALAYLAWAFFAGTVSTSGGVDLLLPGNVALALSILVGTALGTTVVHEVAHVLVGRYYGLQPRVTLPRGGLWSVARTDLTGIWGLDRGILWRPVAAGLMADIGVAAAAMTVAQASSPSSHSGQVARMVIGTVLIRVLWQGQWYMRTDLYFLFMVHTGSLNLRRTARLWLRRSLLPGSDSSRRARFDLLDEPASEVAAARIYCLSLPLALLASVALWWWMLIPLLRLVARHL